MPGMTRGRIAINRAPVLTLWAAVVAERLGFDHAEALTLGKAVAGLNAYAKGVRLGLYEPTPEAVKKQRQSLADGARVSVDLLQRAVPVVRTPEGIRALAKERPVDPGSVERYLKSKFGDALPDVTAAMQKLAAAFAPPELAARGFALYAKFRPEIPEGEAGWGAKGNLDLATIEGLAPGAGSRRR